MRNCWYFPAPHETFNIPLILMLIMISFVDIDIIFMGSMIGRETHGLDVSFWEEDSHIFCFACSNGSMGGDMATTVKHVFPFEVGHVIDGMPYGDDFLSITYGMIWASLIHSVGQEIFGDLVFIFPLEGKIIATQDQHILYTYHKWRRRQCGVG